MQFGSRKNQNFLVLILDIQSSVTRASLMLERSGQKPQIVFTYNKHIPKRHRIISERLINSMVSNIKEINEATYRYIKHHEHGPDFPRDIDSVHVVLSSPWILSQAKSITHKFDRDTEITEDIISEILVNERPKSISSGDSVTPISVVEEKIFNIRINGYPVQTWMGKNAHQLDISFVIGVTSERVLEAIYDACHIYSKRQIKIHSSLLLQYIGMQEVLPEFYNYTLIHIHGEITDVTITDNHSCKYFGTYPTGFQTLLRSIARIGKISMHLAESALVLYVQKALTTESVINMNKNIEEPSNFWLSGLKKLLENAGGQKMLEPKDFVVFAGAHEDFFAMLIRNAFGNSRVTMFDIDTLNKFVDYAPHTEHLRQYGLYSVAIHRLLTTHVL